MPAVLAVLLGVCIALPFVALKSHLECCCAMVKEPCAHMKAFFEPDSPRTAANLDRFDEKHSRYDNCYPHRETLIRRSLLLLERKFIEVL
jgi:hypothetical protein